MVDYSTLSDNELIGLLKKSDHAAFTEIYSRYYRLMIVFAYKKLRDEDEAKDAVQLLFTNIWAKKENLLVTKNLAPYLYVSLRNQIITSFTHQLVENKYIMSLNGYLNSVKNANTDHQVRTKELQSYIDKEIQALPAKMQKAFKLSRKDNFSYHEIATILNTSENNVSKHVNNALRILKAKLSTLLTSFF